MLGEAEARRPMAMCAASLKFCAEAMRGVGKVSRRSRDAAVRCGCSETARVSSMRGEVLGRAEAVLVQGGRRSWLSCKISILFWTEFGHRSN